MPCPSSCPPGLLALMAPGLALMATFSLPSHAGDRRALPVEKPPGVKGRTLILLDVNTKSPVRIISENFLSLQLDPSIIHDGWLDFLSSRRLVTLARGLAPAFLRFAGKRTDFLQFHNVKNPAKSRGGPGPDYYLKNYEDDIVRSDIALDKQKGCKIAQHPDIMLELQREKAAQMHLVLLKEQFSNTYSNLTLTGQTPNSSESQHHGLKLQICLQKWLVVVEKKKLLPLSGGSDRRALRFGCSSPAAEEWC
ncbi:hypothetical protein Q9233_006094 [Columba guinea]|nr:hypothetical protein Q9233_006094 [Columba guinea]